jgi:hypothetical protein
MISDMAVPTVEVLATRGKPRKSPVLVTGSAVATLGFTIASESGFRFITPQYKARMFVAPVPVDQTRVTWIGRIEPVCALENVTTSPDTIVTFTSPIPPMYKALV